MGATYDTVVYFFGRVTPAAVNLAAFVAYARILPAEEFGRYAVALSGATILNITCFQWLKIAIARYGPSEEGDGTLGLTTLVTFAWLSGLTLCGATCLCLFLDTVHKALLLGSVAAGIAIAWAEVAQEWLRARLAVTGYAALFFSRAVLTNATGLILVGAWPRAECILAAIVGGNVIATLPLFTMFTRDCAKHGYDRALVAKHFRYALPVSVSLSMNGLAGEVDKWLLWAFYGPSAVAVLAAVKDPIRGVIVLLAQVTNLGSFPRAVCALRKDYPKRAAVHLRAGGKILLSVTLPAGVGLWLVRGDFVGIVCAASCRDAASSLVLPIVLGAVVHSWRAFYVEQAFFIDRSTAGQIKAALITISSATVAGFSLIPFFGAQGSAWSWVIACVSGIVGSWYMGKDVFALSFVFRGTKHIFGATLCMASVVVCVPYANIGGMTGLFLKCLIGVGVYGVLIRWMGVFREMR